MRLAMVKEAARELGIAWDRTSATGLVDGRLVEIEVGEDDQPTPVEVRSVLDPPLDLGLVMERRNVILTHAPRVVTGSEDLDAEFSIHADEDGRLRELFTGELRDHLVRVHRMPLDFRLDDRGCVVFQLYASGVGASWIVSAAHVVAETADHLDRARRHLRPAERLRAHAEVLRELASARGFSFSTTPLAVRGRVEGRAIALTSARTGHDHHALTAHASFEAELGLGLVVRRQHFVDGLRTMLGGQDLLVGDDAFDRRFLVQASPKDAAHVPALLDAEARAVLLALDERAGPVSIDDTGLVLGPLPHVLAPGDLAWAVDTLDEARARIERNRLGHGDGGPYR